jgi:2-iminoacetate synthase ThiH
VVIMQDWQGLSAEEMLERATRTPLDRLLAEAAGLRDQGHGRVISYSRKVFIPLTKLCRDVCHYCTFAERPSKEHAPYLTRDEVLAIARAGAAAGCQEALFTLGDKPELRYGVAAEALAALGYSSTLAYLAAMCEAVIAETKLLPHVNPGVMTADDIAMLRPVSASMGIMLESASERLCQPGQVHYGSPDKHPAIRLETIRLAGEQKVPFTTGILIGIGETRQPYPGSHHPELPRQAGYEGGRSAGARSRRSALDHRRGAADPRPGHEPAGAAEPLAADLSPAHSGRPQRLGRHLACHPGPCQSGSALA